MAVELHNRTAALELIEERWETNAPPYGKLDN